jgi:endonuclease-3
MTRKKAARKKTTNRAESRRVSALLEGLAVLYPDVETALQHENAYQLLIATILSAQCTDARVNQVTPELFARFPTPAALGAAPQSEVEELIRSTGFFRNKARAIIGASQRLADAYGGEVPRTMEEMLTLPGVARKTANVVLGSAFGIAVGVVVDTHVKRVAARLGLTQSTRPDRIEQDLMARIPREEWITFSHRVIWHGRRLCKARRPRCTECPLVPHCPAAALE